jgi:hypothetical protein
MDWKRAKSILIFVFFVLNLILAAVLYENFNVKEISEQTISNTQKILEQNDVHIECPIPTYVGKDYILQHEDQVIDKEKIASVLLGENYSETDENVFISGTRQLIFDNDFGFEYSDANGELKVYTDNKNGIDIYIKELSKKLDIPYHEFKQDGYYPPNVRSAKGVRIVYKGVYKDYDVFDNYIDVEIKDLGITSFKYQYKSPLSITARDINVIPAYEILISKITNYPGIIITNVDIGFKGYTHVDEETKTLYEGLAWRIKTWEGKEYYFNARSGEEIM